MISSRLLRPLVCIAFAMGLLIPSPASADVAAGVFVGTGTFSPGLPTTGCANQVMSFDGTAIVGEGHTGLYGIHFDGVSSICESLSAGAGCGRITGGFTADVCYNRTRNILTATGTGTVNGQWHVVTFYCVFTETSVNPESSYGLVCDILVQ